MKARALWHRALASKRVRGCIVIYILLLLLSHLTISLRSDDRPPPARGVTIQAMSCDGAVPGRTTELAYDEWSPEAALRAEALPLLLLHGSPGSAKNFDVMGPELALAAERRVIAFDRPGFGGSSHDVPSYSLRANARSVVAAMDEMGIERAHVLGWSQGGGAAIWMAELAPERVASVTLVGSIGVQEGEGSGDYYFEHGKYALGYAALVVMPDLLPHFGLLGPRAMRKAFIRDFWDTDQRLIRPILEDFETPALIIHGRNDPFVPAWAAEEHHRITPGSRLLMLDASHFFVFSDADNPVGMSGSDRGKEARAEAVRSITRFVDRHDDSSAIALPGSADRAPAAETGNAEIGGFGFSRQTHWAIVVLLIALATLVSEDLTVIAAGLLVSTQRVDIAVALLGCYIGILGGDWGLVLLGRFAGRRVLRFRFFRKAIPERSLKRWEKLFDNNLAKAVFLSRMLPGTRLPMYVSAGILSRRLPEFMFWMAVAIAVWTPLLLGLALVIGAPIYSFFAEVVHGPLAVVLAFVILFVIIRFATYQATYSGRHKFAADMKRLTAYEFWPAAVFYLPLIPKLIHLAATRGGLLAFTCANPGIRPAGGVVHEPKTDIIRALSAAARRIDRPDLVLPAVCIAFESDEDARTDSIRAAIETNPQLGGHPLVLKPERAQRGVGVRIVRSEEDTHRYAADATGDTQAQRYHPGPHEVGIFWSRVPTAGKPVDEWPGEIFSVTRKTFPVIVGDGEHTIEHLIWDHRRYRMQAAVFLRRFEDRLDEILPAGEELALTQAGNHAQGTMFSDGADLITPELARTIDDLAQAYRDEETGARIDFGRFDARFASFDDLKAGKGLAVVELNGVLSESTNLYDPERSIRWAYATLFRQWTRLYDIAAARKAEGARPASALALLRLVRENARRLPSGSASD